MDEKSHFNATAVSDQAVQSRRRLVAFLFGLAVLHGMVINLMPVMFTTMESTFGIDKVRQALLKSYFFGGSAVALVMAGYLTQYLGARRMTILLGIVAGVGALLFGLAPTYELVLVAAGVLAIGIAPLAAVYAAIIAGEFPDVSQRMYMWTYGFMAASATVATFVLGALLDNLPRYNIIFIVLALVIWCWTALLLAIGWGVLDRAVRISRAPHDTGAETTALRAKLAAGWRFLTSGIFARGALYLMCVLMVLDYLCASNMMAWTPRFFEELYGAKKILGGLALSASSAGVCTGRIIMGAFPPGKISDRVLLAGCYTGGVLCFGLIVLLRPPYAGSMALMFLAGAFISAQAPTMGSLAVAKFGRRAPVVIPLYEAVGTTAGIVGPPLVGHLADRTGELGTVLWVVPAAGVTLGAIAIGWELYDRRRERGNDELRVES